MLGEMRKLSRPEVDYEPLAGLYRYAHGAACTGLPVDRLGR